MKRILIIPAVISLLALLATTETGFKYLLFVPAVLIAMTYGSPDYVEPTPEVNLHCDQVIRPVIYETIIPPPRGYYENLGDHTNLCHIDCQRALIEGKLDFVEKTSSGIGYRDKDIPKNVHFGLVSEPGLHRFSRVKKGDPRCQMFEQIGSYIGSSYYERLSPNVRPLWDKYCVAVENITAPSARYELQRVVAKDPMSRKADWKSHRFIEENATNDSWDDWRRIDSGRLIRCEASDRIIDRYSNEIVAETCLGASIRPVMKDPIKPTRDWFLHKCKGLKENELFELVLGLDKELLR